MVNKKKLFQKLNYFKSIKKACVVDHKSDFSEVTIPVNIELFKKIIDCVTTDQIDIIDNEIFKRYEIFKYLIVET